MSTLPSRPRDATLPIERTLLRLLTRALPPDQRYWGVALLAELEAFDSASSRARFTAGALWALGGLAAVESVRAWRSEWPLMFGALAGGIAIAIIDARLGTRLPKTAAIVITTALLSMRHPRAFWRWSLLIGVGTALVAHATGFVGPYAEDRGDVWYAMAPALFGAVLGWAGARLRSAVEIGQAESS